MNDAELDLCLWVDRLDRLRKTLQAINAGDQDVFDTAVLEFGQHAEPELRALALADPQTQQLLVALEINAQGQIHSPGRHPAAVAQLEVDGVQVDKLRVVEFADPLVLEKAGDTLFATRDPNAIPDNTDFTQVRQGFLELSNVDPVRMMTEMIEVLRGYESYQKAIRALDDASAKSINQVGQVA